MPESLRHVSIIPELLNGCAMFTRLSPFSLDANAAGIHSIRISAPPPAMTCGGAISGPPDLIVTSKPSSS